MKKLLLFAVLLCVGIMVQAQNYSPEAKAKKRVAQLDEKLELSEEQKEKITELFVAQTQKDRIDGRKLGQMTKEEREAYKVSKKAQRAEFDKQLEAILTPEQVEKYQARKGKGKANKKDKPSMSQRKAAKLAEQLGLNAEQKEAVITALDDYQATRGGSSLKDKTKEEKKAAMEARKAAKQALEEQFKTIFTPEQYAAYQQLDKEKKEGKKMKKTNNSGAMIQKKVNHLSEALSLTTEQKAQVSTLLTEQHQAKVTKPAKKDWTPANRAANKENRKGAKANYDAKMKEILTAEQYATFQTLQEGRREKGRKRGSLNKQR